MKSLKLFLLAFAATITLGAFAQDSVLPSRPRFQSVGVGVAAPAGTGNITISGELNANTVRTQTHFQSISYQLVNGSFTGFFDAGGAGINVGSTSAHPLSLYAGGTIGARMQPAGPFDALNGFTTNGTAALFPQGLSGSGASLTALNAGNISTGTLAVARGGTNLTAAAQDATMIGNATTWVSTTLPSCSQAHQAVQYNSSTNAFACNANLSRARAGRINIVSAVSCSASETQFDTGNTTTPVAIGTCTYQWGTAFGVSPICTVSPIAASRIAFVSARTTTSVTVNLTDLTGALVNGSVDVHCLGGV